MQIRGTVNGCQILTYCIQQFTYDAWQGELIASKELQSSNSFLFGFPVTGVEVGWNWINKCNKAGGGKLWEAGIYFFAARTHLLRKLTWWRSTMCAINKSIQIISGLKYCFKLLIWFSFLNPFSCQAYILVLYWGSPGNPNLLIFYTDSFQNQLELVAAQSFHAKGINWPLTLLKLPLSCLYIQPSTRKEISFCTGLRGNRMTAANRWHVIIVTAYRFVREAKWVFLSFLEDLVLSVLAPTS